MSLRRVVRFIVRTGRKSRESLGGGGPRTRYPWCGWVCRVPVTELRDLVTTGYPYVTLGGYIIGAKFFVFPYPP